MHAPGRGRKFDWSIDMSDSDKSLTDDSALVDPGSTGHTTAPSPSDDVRKVRVRPTGRRALIEAAFAAATTPSQRRLFLRRTRSIVLVVRTPSTSWVKPIESYVSNYFRGGWQV